MPQDTRLPGPRTVDRPGRAGVMRLVHAQLLRARRTLCAAGLLLAAGAVAPACVWADPIDTIETPPGLHVTASMSNGILTIENPAANQADIIGVGGKINSDSVIVGGVGSPTTLDWSCHPANPGEAEQLQSRSFVCGDQFGGTPPGGVLKLDVGFSESYQGGFKLLRMFFDHPACSAQTSGAQSSSSGAAVEPKPGAHPAGDPCATPSHTKIKRVQIDHARRTATFAYTAHRATGYRCELLRNRVIMFVRACGSVKRYTSPLPRGSYVFRVRGVNRAGVDPHPVGVRFTL